MNVILLLSIITAKAGERKVGKEAKETKEKPIHSGHRDRMRQRYINNGLDSLSDHEVLELILFYCIPRKDTNELAHNLLNNFGKSLSAVFNASVDELCKVEGISTSAAVFITMIAPLCRRYNEDFKKIGKLKDPANCGEYLVEYYKDVKVEQVMVLCLDGACRILGLEKVCEGDANTAMINFRKLIETIIKYPNCNACIIAHNHPNGIALPSRDDISATAEIKQTLAAIGITLVDHIIVEQNDYVSMASSPGFKNIF